MSGYSPHPDRKAVFCLSQLPKTPSFTKSSVRKAGYAPWQDAVFGLYLAEEKIEPEVARNMRSWEHSGFSVDQSVLLPAGDQAGIERLVQYMTRCPFSLSRLVKVSDTGQIVYQAEKQACRAFPDPQGDGTQAGVPRNFQILPPLDFLALRLPKTGHAAHSTEGLASD